MARRSRRLARRPRPSSRQPPQRRPSPSMVSPRRPTRRPLRQQQERSLRVTRSGRHGMTGSTRDSLRGQRRRGRSRDSCSCGTTRGARRRVGGCATGAGIRLPRPIRRWSCRALRSTASARSRWCPTASTASRSAARRARPAMPTGSIGAPGRSWSSLLLSSWRRRVHVRRTWLCASRGTGFIWARDSKRGPTRCAILSGPTVRGGACRRATTEIFS